jgi:paraquat-inducible protein B
MNTQIQKVQSTLDYEHKESLPENVYLQLCNQMKELYSEAKEDIDESEGIYEIEYEVIDVVPDSIKNSFKLTCEHKSNVLIELDEEQVSLLQEQVGHIIPITKGHSCADIIRKVESLYRSVYVNPTRSEINSAMAGSCNDCNDELENFMSVHLGFHKSINLLDLKKY